MRVVLPLRGRKAFYHLYRHLPPDLSQRALERSRWLSCWLALRKHGPSSTRASPSLGRGLPRSISIAG